jgi:hypothetical protein
MRRQILGILAATFAAPYLSVCLIMALGLMAGVFKPVDLGLILSLGTAYLTEFGFSLLIVTSALVFALTRLGCRSAACFMASGTLVGLGFAITLVRPVIWIVLATSFSGAICGWIYWRIAVAHQKPEADLY